MKLTSHEEASHFAAFSSLPPFPKRPKKQSMCQEHQAVKAYT